jgi:hypothetical protein
MRPRGTRTIAALTIACLASAPAAARDDAHALLARVREYVAWYDRQLVTLIADERYVQTSRGVTPSENGDNSGGRVLESEFGWVAILVAHDIIGVREVRRVDGRSVAKAYRLRELLERPPADASLDVEAILAESARHNVGEVRRNINFPTFALAYLRRAREQDTRWRAVRSGDHIDLQFEERDRATLVRSADGTRTPARGRFSVDPATGRISACELRVRISRGHGWRPLFYWMLVTFAADARLDLWVPVRMLERYYRPGGSPGSGDEAGEATYSNYRHYDTGGRLIQ